jgi:hypothetical protein
MEDQDKVHRLFEDYYVKYNAQSLDMRDELIKNSPKLFEKTDITSDGILRLYDNKGLYEAAADIHEKYNALYERLSSEEVANRYPFYKYACDKGLVA